MERLQELTAHFQKLGASAHDAQVRAFATLDQIVNGQSALQSFDDLFRYVGIAFLVTMPLIFFLGKGANKQAAAAAH
jgi:DHA2 family multidrug resistance protein